MRYEEHCGSGPQPPLRIDRKHRAEDERARVNVTNAIRALTTKLAAEHPSFGRYLSLTIRTGRFCSYRPDPRSAPQWEF